MSRCKHVTYNQAAKVLHTGGVEVKGKGRMDTYIWDPNDSSSLTPPSVAAAVSMAKVRLV